MSDVPRPAFWRAILAVTALSAGAFGLSARNLLVGLDVPLNHPKAIAILAGAATLTLFFTLLLVLTWTPVSVRLLGWLSFAENLHGSGWYIAGRIVFVLATLLPSALILTRPIGKLIDINLGIRWAIFWVAALVGLIAFQAASRSKQRDLAFLVAVILPMVIYRLATTLLPIDNSPFVPGWSASSRFYDASLFFARRIYGMDIPLSVLHPSLHLLYAVPFAIPGLPIIVHRIWQAVLLLGLTAAVSAAFVRRLRIENRWLRWLAIGWAFIFILQGPIYTHLLVPLVLVFAGYDSDKPARTWVAVLLASLWAGISRINWFPVPGMLAAALFLLETPLAARQGFVRYFARPLGYFVIGMLTAFASQRLYIQFSGNGEMAQFYSSLSSPLLWDRLLPNGTFWLGVLPGALILSLPLWGVIFHRLRRLSLHPLRLVGILAALAVLFLGGMVVSVKIGGGGDLHNLDAYMVMLMLVGGYAAFGRIASEIPVRSRETSESRVQSLQTLHLWPWLGLAVLVPVWMGIQAGGPAPINDQDAAQAALADIRQRAESVVVNGDPVLFISQRHLLTFNEINVPLVADYEKDFLIEMVMSGNIGYLGHFYDDLYHRRFGLIVVEPQVYAVSGPDVHFGQENNAWVLKITRPLLCDYEPVATYPEFNLQLLAPRDGPQECP